MLRTYRTKVTSTMDRGLDWNEIENELQKALNAVRERKLALLYRGPVSERSTSGDVTQLTNESNVSVASGTAGSEMTDVESLSMALQSTSMADEVSVVLGE
jgi:hypothetical protein